MTLSISAEPIPAVARANPASGPVTPHVVSRRYPRAELAALPPGIMLPSAFVLSWIRNKRAVLIFDDSWPKAARVRSVYANSEKPCSPIPTNNIPGSTSDN